MNHPLNKENEVVGSALGNNSCNVDELVYWPGKTTLKLNLVCRTHSPLPGTTDHMLVGEFFFFFFKAMVQTFSRTNKCSGLWQSFVSFLFFFAEREEVEIGFAVPHATSVF